MSTIASDTPSTSRDVAITSKRKASPPIEKRKVLEEDEYLGRMAKIIRRDFFSDPDAIDLGDTTPSSSIHSERTYHDTPGSDRTGISSTSSLRSRREASELRLNDYLNKYTSEDNAYFDKLQAKDVRRHRHKYPWLYKDSDGHNKRVRDQLSLKAATSSKTIEDNKTGTKMIDWKYNPTNALFYPPSDEQLSSASTVNYESSKYMRESIFKVPAPIGGSSSEEKTRGMNRFKDKIGIDGRLLNGSETPAIDGLPLLPATEAPRVPEVAPRIKQESGRFYMLNESPRDELAHRLYEKKISNKIRTPNISTRSDSTRTPKNKLDKIF